MSQKSEHAIQNEARLLISDQKEATCFRVNTGQAWTGNKVERLSDGSIIIHDPRPFKTGLPNGFSDLLCIIPFTIQPHHVGKTIARFGTLEAKSAKGRLSVHQRNFIDQVIKRGGVSGVFRTPEQALEIIRAGKL